MVLGLLLLGTGMDWLGRDIIQAVVYALATRLGARGRDMYVLVLILFIGLFSGWLTLITGEIGASGFPRATRSLIRGVPLATGHAGRRVALPGGEAEDHWERRRRLPSGLAHRSVSQGQHTPPP